MAKTIKLPPDLYQRAAEAAAKLGYSSVDELAAHLIERELARQEEPQDDEAAVEQRLRGLGYLE